MAPEDLIDRLDRMIRDARETPVLGGAMVDMFEVQGLMDELRVDLYEAARQLPDGRWVLKGESVRESLDELGGLVENAKGVPLSDKVRLDRERALPVVQRMRAGVHEERISDAPPEPPYNPAPLLALIDRLDGVIHGAKPVPLTDQVRLEGDEVHDTLDQMRAQVPNAVRGAPPEIRAMVGDLLVPIDELDDLIHNAAPVPLTTQVRVERQKASEIVQTMRAAFRKEHAPR